MNSKIIGGLLLLFFLIVLICSLYSFTIEPLDMKTPSPDPSNNIFNPRTSYKTNDYSSSPLGGNVYNGAERPLYNVEYHDTPEKNDDAVSKGTWVKDPSGNIVFVPWNDTLDNKNTSGAYPYGTSTYVPNYEDSVYLSKSTGLSTVSKVYPTSLSLGICNQGTGIDSKAKTEQSCNALTSDVCASTTCCVLLGGAKCVSGDSNGPFMKANYSDPFIKNKDFYYYNGKCYGNCL